MDKSLCNRKGSRTIAFLVPLKSLKVLHSVENLLLMKNSEGKILTSTPTQTKAKNGEKKLGKISLQNLSHAITDGNVSLLYVSPETTEKREREKRNSQKVHQHCREKFIYYHFPPFTTSKFSLVSQSTHRKCAAENLSSRDVRFWPFRVAVVVVNANLL